MVQNEDTKKTDELSVCVIGHVDAGKSSLCGRLLFETGEIDQRRIDKLKKEAQNMNAQSFYLAHAFDTNPEEKKRGITITSATKQFSTPGAKRRITLVDSPGHRDFVNNMITGAAQCNAAILVISCIRTEFVAGIDKSGQSLEHMLLINALGVKNLIVAMNKMDADSVKWDQKTFDEFSKEILSSYQRLGGKKENIKFVPISGFGGVNINKKDEAAAPWYKGPCLLDLIDQWPYVEHDLTIPFRLSVSGALKVTGAGQIYTGKVYTGRLRLGDKVEAQPSKHCTGVIKTIEKFHKPAEVAFPDDSVGIALKALVPADTLLKKGDVIGAKDTGLQKVSRFEAVMAVTGDVKGVGCGFKPVIATHTAKVASTLVELKSIKAAGRKGGASDNALVERQTIQKGDRIVAEFQPDKGKLVIECDPKFGILTRFVVRNSNKTIGVGQCKKVVNEKYDENYRAPRKEKDEEEAGAKKSKGKKK